MERISTPADHLMNKAAPPHGDTRGSIYQNPRPCIIFTNFSVGLAGNTLLFGGFAPERLFPPATWLASAF
ncbi:hypothetical protein BO82DRAFT_359403 [Aspergillus uvarum CBS 121591]|uniref:Uncharacterized protein n=1 Tax=Aspergillus uvarum CBS 121591 TaxID=1448315 RepID=A0A319CL45_9EURO|nr:hypothetical protein BO82DRAFT_359403 [Aspergillus uvarum CBS 121591]PYH76128.1 hypothetical protein BO82DRAFT_359403 [Aspergillus uvarum CBS 121591]